MFGVVGTVEGKEADFAADRKDAPTIYLFVAAEEGGLPVGGRPLARFMKVLDERGRRRSTSKAAIVAVWLGDKAFDKHKEYLPRINMSLKFEKTSLAAFDGEKSGPNNWGINPDAHLTVVVANKGKVVKSFRVHLGERDRRAAGAGGVEEGRREVKSESPGTVGPGLSGVLSFPASRRARCRTSPPVRRSSTP